MIKLIKLLSILLLGFGLKTFAADPAFIVFYNSGKATKTVAGKAVVLKKGDHLQSTDQVVIPEKTQLVLVCANFAVVQLKTKGTKELKTLLAQCNQKAVSASSAYFKYVWNSFSHAHKAPEKDPRAYMKTYGAASRGKGSLITKLYVDTIHYYTGALTIAWTPIKTVPSEFYKGAVDGDAVLVGKASKYAKIDSISTKLKPGVYYWDMQGQQSARRKYLKLWTKDAYQAAVTKILNGIVATTPAEKAYLTGFILEEQHFLAEAAKYYHQAVNMAPANQIYVATLTRFKP
ncbi:hypothetical protein FA048_06480 [Pedobacter polaris]|uniref:Tetratricopeptide repeat protein n=1 Tax=Pedobacter polaris TaxID=2571273 RepID=A0A4U1CQX7_9SPHI|nr:hypothetical protein [Pedobacter polaris]TKC09856.1 hypothetical protein FA048_06480 [Pedobacter polaris]